jgi:hypothetical protein
LSPPPPKKALLFDRNPAMENGVQAPTTFWKATRNDVSQNDVSTLKVFGIEIVICRTFWNVTTKRQKEDFGNDM